MLAEVVLVLNPLGAGAAEGRTCRVSRAILATSSSTTAWYTASAASLPQVKGPWLAQITPGMAEGSMHRSRKVSTITAPVLRS